MLCAGVQQLQQFVQGCGRGLLSVLGVHFDWLAAQGYWRRLLRGSILMDRVWCTAPGKMVAFAQGVSRRQQIQFCAGPWSAHTVIIEFGQEGFTKIVCIYIL